MEPEKEFETVYFVTAPFANSEEEIATSYILHDKDITSENQVIVLNDDCSIVINDDTTFVDEDGNPIIVNRSGTSIKSEQFTVDIKEEQDSRDGENETSPKEPSAGEGTTETFQSQTVLSTDNEQHISAMEQDKVLVGAQNERPARDLKIISTARNRENSIGNEPPDIKPHKAVSKKDDSQFSNKDTRTENTVACRKIGVLDCGEEMEVAQNVTCVLPEGTVVDNLTCRFCLKVFTRASNKQRHIRVHHKVKKNVGSYIRCIECNTSYKHVQKLRDHLQLTHKLTMEHEELSFPNMNAFHKWKHDIERKDLVSFTLRHGARKTVRGQKFFYVCHRSGRYSTRLSGPRQRMIKTNGTCKLGIMCTAAVYCEDRGNEVFVKYCSHHYGHGKETSFVQLSTEEQNAIQENVSKGIPFENLLDNIRESSSKDHHQMGLLKKKDIKFINNAFSAQEYSPGLSDAESVDRWVRLCCQMEDSPVLFYKQEDGPPSKEEEFILVIMTEFQKQILLSSEKQVVSVDSLYRRKGGRFYLTCLFVMDECEVAFPVAFCISHKVDKRVIKQFLSCVRESTGPLSCSYFISDCERFYYEAWVEVMNDESKWLWSLWYVDNRFRVQMRCYKGNVVKRAETYKTMRMLLECQNPNVFETMYKNFVDSLMSDQQSKNLGNFITQRYSLNKEMWAKCYQRDIKLSTILNLESLHRTLRYCCREGRKNRLDKFIFVIMKLVRYKMLGRLTSMLDSEKISLAIDAIDMCHGIGLDIPTHRISSLSDKIWLITGDEEEENVYVTREFDSCPEHCLLKCMECDICVHMFSCSCMHSMINANLCQHIHAVVWKFLTPHFSPMGSPSRNDDEEEEIEDINLSVAHSKSSELLEGVLKRSHDVYKKVRSNKCTLSHESLTAVMQRLNECIDICDGKIVNNNPCDAPVEKSSFVDNISYENTSSSQPFLIPNTHPTILPQNQPLSQYVLILPNNFNNGAFVPK